MEPNTDILSILTKHNIVLDGHFILSSGLRSPKYVQCAKIFQEPKLANSLIAELAKNIKRNNTLYSGNSPKFDIIVSPAVGGILAGYELARQLDCQNIFAERPDGVNFIFKRGFELAPNSKVLIVEDVITTGKSSAEVAKLISKSGSVVIGLASIIDRLTPEGRCALDYEVTSILNLNIPTYSNNSLPEDLKSIPPIKPGSRKMDTP